MLDAAPRTEAAERAAAASDRAVTAAIGAGVVGAAVVAASGGGPGAAATPTAARELMEAMALITKAADALGEHPAGDELRRAVAQANGLRIRNAAARLAAMVRHLYPRLRDELGLTDVPLLTNWEENDAEDDAALLAAGLGRRAKAIRIGVAVTVFVAIYVVIRSL